MRDGDPRDRGPGRRGDGLHSQDTPRVLRFPLSNLRPSPGVVWHQTVLTNRYQPTSHARAVHFLSQVKHGVFYLLHPVFTH